MDVFGYSTKRSLFTCFRIKFAGFSHNFIADLLLDFHLSVLSETPRLMDPIMFMDSGVSILVSLKLRTSTSV